VSLPIRVLPWMGLTSTGAIDKALKGPPVEVLVQWRARRWTHTLEVGVLFVRTCARMSLIHSLVLLSIMIDVQTHR
jgi:hypothetical protein